MAVKLSPVFNDAQLDSLGAPLNAGKLYTYAAGTLTPQATYTTSVGNVAQANPIVLNARGEPDSPIWLTEAASYKFILKTSADATIRTVDNISGVNDSTVAALSEWFSPSVSSLTFVSASSFTVAGDQTSTFHAGRRIKATVTAGTVYGTIISSVFGASTTVTLGMDSTTLDSGLSAVQLGILSSQNSSVPNSVFTFGNTFRNLLINPSGGIDQRLVTAATADDNYICDRWYVLTQTNTVTPSALSNPENGFVTGKRITQSQAVAQRFGFAQIVEAINCEHLRGSSAVFVPRVRISNSQALRYAILEWTGTENAVTSDVVNTWTSTNYTAGNFFISPNLTVVAVGAQTPAANTWTSLSPLIGTISNSLNNLIVMVWTEGTAAQNVTLDWDFAQAEAGTVATGFERRPFGTEFDLCQRYLPGVAAHSTTSIVGPGMCHATTEATIFVPFKTRARAAPTGIVVSNAGHISVWQSTGTLIAGTAIVFQAHTNQDGGLIVITGASGLTAGNGTFGSFNNANAYVLFTGAEL